MTLPARSARQRSRSVGPVWKRDLIYVAFLLVLMVGMLIDAAIGADTDGVARNLNTFMLAVGCTLLAYAWQREDARSRGRRLRTSARVMTLAFAPAGIAIHLFQSRRTEAAMGLLLLLSAGVFAVVILSSSLGDWLVARGVFPLEMSDGQ